MRRAIGDDGAVFGKSESIGCAVQRCCQPQHSALSVRELDRFSDQARRAAPVRCTTSADVQSGL
jgi:hypothetical protein